MIESRLITYEWQSTAGNSRSVKRADGVQVGLNYVQNPSAEGATSYFTAEPSGAATTIVSDTLTGPGTKSYRVTAPSTTVYSGAVSSATAATPGQFWWFRARVRLDPSVLGGRILSPTLRFYDSAGNRLSSAYGDDVEFAPAGVFHRWTGTLNASTSEQYTGVVKRVNLITNPSFENNNAGIITAASAWTKTVDATIAHDGTHSALLTRNTADAGNGSAYTTVTGLTVGQVYTFSFWTRSDNVGAFYTAKLTDGANLEQGTWAATGDWLRVSVPFTPTASSVTITWSDDMQGEGVVNGANLWIDSLLLEAGGLGDYFDGSSTSTGTGNDTDVLDVLVSGTAPANTVSVRATVLRTTKTGFESTADVFYMDSLLLTPDASTLAVPDYYDGDSPDDTEFVYIQRPGDISTDEYWEIDGIPLNTYGYNIQTWGGNRQSPPAVRGANITVPGRPGTVFMQKELDANQFTLSMWVQGTDESGNVPTDRSTKMQYDANWAMLRKLLFQVRRELTVTKRWVDPETGAVESATGKAQYNGGLEPSMTGRSRSLFSVDFIMNDPFFYGNPHVLTANSGELNHVWHEDVEGDWRTTDIQLQFSGPRVNPQVSAYGVGTPKIAVRYQGTLAATDVLTIDVSTFTATLVNGNGVVSNVTGSIVHSGDTQWLALEPGVNAIAFSSTSGTGPMSLTYTPVFF